MILNIFIIIIINIKFFFCELSKIKILIVKNSIIDKIVYTCIPKEKQKINMKNSNKNLLEPKRKKSNKFKTKSNKINPIKINYIKNIYKVSQIYINGSNVLLENDKKVKKGKFIRKNNIEKKKNTKVIVKEKEINVNKKEDNEQEDQKIEDKNDDLNDLPFTRAKKEDKRNIFQIFASIIIKKITLINLFCGDEKIKILLFNENILSLLVDFFFNALLYSDEVVSHKYHNNGKLDFIVSLILSLLSNIISSMICYFLKYSELIEERLDQILQLKRANKYPYILSTFLKYLKLKVLLYTFKELFIIFFCFYYLIIFTIIYSYSKNSLLFNFLYSLIEKIIQSLIISISIATIRKIGLTFSNRYIYNTSKYINDKF